MLNFRNYLNCIKKRRVFIVTYTMIGVSALNCQINVLFNVKSIKNKDLLHASVNVFHVVCNPEETLLRGSKMDNYRKRDEGLSYHWSSRKESDRKEVNKEMVARLAFSNL